MNIVIVVGDDGESALRFKKIVHNLKHALIKDFGLLESDFIILTECKRDIIYGALERLFLDKENEDICLFYLGHGQENGWGLSGYRDIELLEYESLRLLLVQHKGNLIFINDCCYAMAAQGAVESRFGDYLLVAAMPDDVGGITFGFLDKILYCWQSCQPCRIAYPNYHNYINGRGERLWRGNLELSALMYPEKAQSST